MYVLPSGPDSATDSPHLLDFVTFGSISDVNRATLLATLYLKVFSENYSDTIVSTIHDIAGIQLHTKNSVHFLVTPAGDTISADKLHVTELNCRTDTLQEVKDVTIEFYSFSPYSGDLTLNRIVLREDGTHNSRRELICRRVIRGRIIE